MAHTGSTGSRKYYTRWVKNDGSAEKKKELEGNEKMEVEETCGKEEGGKQGRNHLEAVTQGVAVAP
jgi:hypothetical protein